MEFLDYLEFSANRDPSRNYCLWSYPRPASAEGKFRAVNLLLKSFSLDDCLQQGAATVDAIRAKIGMFNTVFGVKFDGTALSWEFYFYDYQRRRRVISIPRVLSALGPFYTTRIRPDEQLPYFMFSIDIHPAKIASSASPLDVVHIYVGNPGSSVSSGVSYGLRPNGIKLENFYFFFDAREHIDLIVGKIMSSPHFDSTSLSIDAVLLPQLRGCQTICVANKQENDCIYFSGINVFQLCWFLRHFEYPQSLIEFAEINIVQMDHLLFDVGFDYRMEGGNLRRLKSGYYNVF